MPAGHAHRAHRADRAAARGRWSAPTCRKRHDHEQLGAAAAASWAAAASSVNVTVKLMPRAERTRTSDQIATDLRRRDRRHSRHHDHDARVGRQPAAHARARRRQSGQPAGGRNPRRGSGRVAPHRRDVLEVLKETPGIANPQIGREEGRPELAIRVDRPKAALLGLTVSGVASTIRTNISGTQAAMSPRARQGIPHHRPAARGRPRPGRVGQRRADLHAAGPGAAGQEPARPDGRRRARPRSSARTSSASCGSTPSSKPARRSATPSRPSRPGCPVQSTSRRASRSASAPRSNSRPRPSSSSRCC